jgi:hypothetical protein
MTVGMAGFREQRANASRIALAKDVLAWCGSQDVEAVFFPAGYLRAPWQDTAAALDEVGPLLEEARKRAMALVVGVDLCAQSQMDKHNRDQLAGLTKKRTLPMGLVAWWPGRKRPVFWRQRSTNANNHTLSAGSDCAEMHAVEAQGGTIAVLACGEGFNPRVREAVLRAHPQPVVVVDLAHIAQGFRFFLVLDAFAEAGLPTFLSVHTSTGRGMKQARFPGKPPSNPEVYEPTRRFTGTPGAEVVVWELRKGGSSAWKDED